MTNQLVHRGPNDAGYWLDGSCPIALGHRRLSIVDLSESGHQPMRSIGGRYTLVFNGEIYNFKVIRKSLELKGHVFRGQSDTEVMLAAFEQWGVEKSVSRFIGMFAFAVWDAHERQLVICRDRLGKKPLYYGFIADGFAFGSELRALRQYPGWSPEISRDALCLYMRHNYVPSPWSIYKGIFKLPPAHILRVGVREGKPYQVSLDCYWSVSEQQRLAQSHQFWGGLDDAVDELERLLGDATALRMISDVPLGAFLSGGIDSSLIVSLMQSRSTQPVRTFTIGFNETGYNEAAHARAIATHLGTDHTELYVTSEDALKVIPKLSTIYDEPFSDSSQIPMYLVCSMARKNVTVALSGDGGDEAFAGYNRYLWWKQIWGRTSHVPNWFLRYTASAIQCVSANHLDLWMRSLYRVLPRKFQVSNPGDRLHKLASVLAINDPQQLYRRLVSHWEDPEKIVLNGKEPATLLSGSAQFGNGENFVNRMMLLDTLTYLPDDILVKVDRASMAVSLETRAPLLDHRVLEFAWSLPLEMKLAGTNGKRILKSLLYRYVPPDLVDRPKAGFGIPLDSWLRGPLREWAEDLLSPSRLRRDGFFDVESIRTVWSEHLSGARQWQYQLWDVLMFQSWIDDKDGNHMAAVKSM